MIADVFPRDKLTVPMSVFSIAQIAGAALSLIAGGALIGWLAQMPSSVAPGQGFAVWRLMFLYASVPAFIGAALIFLVSEPKRRGKPAIKAVTASARAATRSEEHTSELQELNRIPYVVFCSKTKINY